MATHHAAADDLCDARATKRTRTSLQPPTRHAATAKSRGTQRRPPCPAIHTQLDDDDASDRLLRMSLVARFYPLVLTLPEYTRRAFRIELCRRSQDNTSGPSNTQQQIYTHLSRFLVGIPDNAAAIHLSQCGATTQQQKARDPAAAAVERREPIRQVVHRAQLSIIRALSRDSLPTTRKTNVLTLGYSKPDERIDTFNALAAGHVGLANHFPNTIVTTIITAPEWALLLERIGDDGLHRLLTTTAVFAPLVSSDGADASCFVQLCGQPLSEMPELPVSGQLSSVTSGDGRSTSVPSASPRFQQEQQQQQQPQSRDRKRKRRSSRVQTPIVVEVGAEAAGSPVQAGSLGTTTGGRTGSLVRIASAASTAMLSDRDQAAGAAAAAAAATAASDGGGHSQAVRSHSQIAFVRSRIFYARPIRGKKAKVELGLPFVHVLNRSANPAELSKVLPHSTTRPLRAPSCYPGDPKADQTFAARRSRHVLKYILPRQFGLHNVFTTPKDARTTSQPFSDYTTRENELRSRPSVGTPNRLRPVLPLITIMIRRHDMLDYKAVLDRCCPSRLPRRRLTSADKERIAEELTEQPLTENMAHRSASGTPDLLCNERDRADALSGKRNKSKKARPPNSAEVLQKVSLRAEQKPRFANYAVPALGQVVHFVTTVVRRLVPRDLFGSQHNQKLILKQVAQFVRARRFETSTLHQAMQGLRVTDIDWTLPPGKAARWQRPTAAESAKRRELLAEFVYWLFDSLVIPLLRTTFYATESAAFRNRVLYFRQDDWHAISRPLLGKLKETVFEPLTRSEALAVMSSRKLGYSHIRLLPKETGVRPIVNLRRRSTRQQTTTGTGVDQLKRKRESERLGQSINFILQSAFHILTYEKKRCTASDELGASVFGPNEIYSQLKRFSQELDRMPSQRLAAGGKRKLYFVKVDVKCAFDSIDQDRLVEIIQDIICERDGYLIHRFAKVMPASASAAASGGGTTKRSFVKMAQPDGSQRLFVDLASELASALHHVVFVDSVVYRHEERSRVLNLLHQHVMGNIVKISGHFYRQKVGIPQGSSLSTMLCSFFYAHLERTKLAFVREKGSLLMRYTDDFLFITTSKRMAKTFYEVMYQGHEEYGCFIAREKTLVNFDMRQPLLKEAGTGGGDGGRKTSDGSKPFVERCSGRGFPWCGVLLDVHTLAVEPDLERYRNIDMRDTLTVETSRRPGIAFIEKLFQATRPRCHILYTDTSLNSQAGVYRNLYSTFVVAALKYEAYLAELKKVDVVFRSAFLISAIQNVIRYTTTAVARRAGAAKKLHREARCVVSSEWIGWLGHHAFLRVLTTRHIRDPTRRQRLDATETEVVRHLSNFTSRPALSLRARVKLANQAWTKAVKDFAWM